MNITVFIHDKAEIESFLRKDVRQNLYSLGDLDDFFWNYTAWFGLKSADRLKALALLYTGASSPTLLAFCAGKDRRSYAELLSSCARLLPRSFYAHLSPGLGKALCGAYKLKSHGVHYKMALTDKKKLMAADVSDTAALSKRNLPELLKLYAKSYPGNWFEPRMLETSMYYGIRAGGVLAGAAGVHVYSPKYKAAALGNITVLPDQRGKGLAKKVTARLCRELLKKADHIGLNVKAGNEAAISCYRALGFKIISSYEEYSAGLR